mgnify:FL=1
MKNYDLPINTTRLGLGRDGGADQGICEAARVYEVGKNENNLSVMQAKNFS